MKRLVAKPRRKRKSIIFTMKYCLDIHEDDPEESKRIGKLFIAWARDKFSNWDDTILQYFLYENGITQNSDDDRLMLEGHLDKIIKNDCAVPSELDDYNDSLDTTNKDTSSSESLIKPKD